jgi:hypothetical protein
MLENNKRNAVDFYLARESRKGRTIDPNVDENIRVMRCCDHWKLNQTLSAGEIKQLVTVICEESRELIKGGRRLLMDIAQEADRQLKTEWKSGRNKKFIEKLLEDLGTNENAFESDPIILREKVNGEPPEGSYYVQDGNHRIITSGVFLLRTGRFPKLTFHIGQSIDQRSFFRSNVVP